MSHSPWNLDRWKHALNPEKCSAVHLGARAKYWIHGPDATRYLNGQLTNDLKTWKKEAPLYGLLCNAKGGIEAELWGRGVRDREGVSGWLLDGEETEEDFLEARLGKYLIADDAEILSVGSEWSLWHGWGRAWEEAIKVWMQEIEHSREGKGAFIQKSQRFGVSGWDVGWQVGGASFNVHQVSEFQELSQAEVDALAVLQGFPRWGKEIRQGGFVAELGIESYAISFHKGCYVGQEIISRMKRAGKIHRQLVAWSLLGAPENVPSPGDSVWDADQKQVGEITSVALHPETGAWQGMAFLKSGFLDEMLEQQSAITIFSGEKGERIFLEIAWKRLVH